MARAIQYITDSPVKGLVWKPTPENIVRLRGALDMNQRDFAEHIGVGKATVSRWESEDFHPSVHTAKLLLTAALKAGFVRE